MRTWCEIAPLPVKGLINECRHLLSHLLLGRHGLLVRINSDTHYIDDYYAYTAFLSGRIAIAFAFLQYKSLLVSTLIIIKACIIHIPKGKECATHIIIILQW